ncbi:HNH endonuclease [Myxococcaceae bacterium GXIMD 01537]
MPTMSSRGSAGWLLLVGLLSGLGCASGPTAFSGRGAPAWSGAASRELHRTGSPASAPRHRGEIGPIERGLLGVDHFQGLLVRSGIPFQALPREGQRLVPEEALRLLSLLAEADVPLRDFAPARVAAHLLWEVVEGGRPVRREELHERMNRFVGLFVLRPDGYLTRALTGEAVQHVGEVRWEDGTPNAEGLEVGAFFSAPDGEWLYPVDERLRMSADAPPVWGYTPQEGVVLHAGVGAGEAVIEAVLGLVSLVLHPGESLEGLTHLPVAVRTLLQHSPAYWERYRALPPAEQVRQAARLVTGTLLVLGTAGAGGARAASVGGSLGKLGVPVLSLSAEGTLAVRAVVVPAGRAVTALGSSVGAVYVLHMAAMGDGGAGAKPGTRGGPGSGKRFSESVKDAAELDASGKCVFCQRPTTRAPGPAQRNIDHAIPKSKGGNNTLDNAQNTCRTCNQDKGVRTTEEYLETGR